MSKGGKFFRRRKREPEPTQEPPRETLADETQGESLTRADQETIVGEIRGAFTSYGHMIITHLTNEYLQHGHLKTTCRLLNLNEPEELKEQFVVLTTHLDHNGSRPLMQHILDQVRQEGQPEQDSGPGEKAEPAGEAEAPRKPASPFMPKQPSKERAEPPDIHNADTQVTRRRSVPEPSPDEPLLYDEKTGLPIINGRPTERRSGRDRRASEGRRQKRDRRQIMDIIYKNQRYGGERRDKKDRRFGKDRRRQS